MTAGSGPGRPGTLVVVLGTGTEVGKTWVTASLARRLRAAGVVVSARKPAQSFAPDDPVESTDAALLGAAVGEPPGDVCPPWRWYRRALAPPMAADSLGLPAATMDELVAELRWPPRLAGDPASVGFVETAGGVRSPLAAPGGGGAGDATELVRRLAPDRLLLVAPAELGSINAVRLSVAALAPAPGDPPGPPITVVLNRFDGRLGLHRRTRRWLIEHDGLDVVALPSDGRSLAARLAAPRNAQGRGVTGP